MRELDAQAVTQAVRQLCIDATRVLPADLEAVICAGSGPPAVAALNTGRRFICFETAPAFYAPATERIRMARAAVEAGEKGV